MTPVEQITSLYIGYFGRAPDPVGLNYWVGRLEEGFSLAEIAESFSVQAESQALYPYLANPNIASPQTFIAQVYANLFNRAPDAEGLAYWTAQLNSGTDIGDFILDVISGAVNNPADQAIIDNKIEVGVDFALRAANEAGFVYDDNAAAAAFEVINGVDGTEESVEAGKAESEDFFENGNVPGGGVVGEIITLTTGVDERTGTANNDTFRAVVAQSLDSTDILAGGAGNDVLNISEDGISDTNNAPVITGIETINNGDDDELNLASVNGVERINTSIDGATYINAARSTVFAATASGVAVGISYAGSSAGEGTAVNFATDIDGSAGTATFNIGTVAADAAGIEVVNLDVSGDADDVTTVTLDADLSDLETINITGNGETVIAGTLASVDLESIDASEASGGVTIALAAGANSAATAADLTVTLGGGGDTLTLAGQQDATVSLGAGIDTFTGNGDEAGLSLTLGAGTDTVVFTNLTNIDDASEANFASDIIQITDFNGAQDLLNIGGAVTLLGAPTNPQLGVITDQDSLYDALQAAADFLAASVAADDAVAFQYGGNTYIFVDNGVAGDFDAGDGLVELTGFTGAFNGANSVF